MGQITIETNATEKYFPDISNGSGMFKQVCMTVFFHDYVFPPSRRVEILPFISMEGKPKEPIPIQIFSVYTLDLVRTLTNEQLGILVRDTLNKLEDSKRKIEEP